MGLVKRIEKGVKLTAAEHDANLEYLEGLSKPSGLSNGTYVRRVFNGVYSWVAESVGSVVQIVNNFTTGGTDKAASAETVKLLYEGKQIKEKVEVISSAGTRIISNTDDNTVFYLKSANIVFEIPNGLNDISFNVSVRGANKPSYMFGGNYTTDPSDANDLDLIYNSSHHVRKIGTEILFN